MAMDVSYVTLTGRVGTDPDIFTTKNGTGGAEFRMAVNQYKGPNKDSTTGWYSIVLWGGRANVAQYIQKGMGLTVVGTLTQNEWTTDKGETRTDMVVDAAVVKLPPKSSGSGTQKGSGRTTKREKRDDLPF